MMLAIVPAAAIAAAAWTMAGPGAGVLAGNPAGHEASYNYTVTRPVPECTDPATGEIVVPGDVIRNDGSDWVCAVNSTRFRLFRWPS
jgi:hypothetical protein